MKTLRHMLADLLERIAAELRKDSRKPTANPTPIEELIR